VNLASRKVLLDASENWVDDLGSDFII